ncbi:hypothetical protein EMPS_10131 [Entomortierella parvispora]|uniref:glucan endo-1,3-beta-D-glucosidase n=1 Tax=Entomortierella parvispora TaxID=205924 RepID=A0A9P3HJG3_9FUNG|nr:hypothetical protein EMPS_10131 [Entomortierella parvispora]
MKLLESNKTNSSEVPTISIETTQPPIPSATTIIDPPLETIDIPQVSAASSSSSPTTSAPYTWAPEQGFLDKASSSNSYPSVHVSPFAHPLDVQTSSEEIRSSRNDHNSGDDFLPMTPGEDMVFDRGLLFSTHRIPTVRSDPSHAVHSSPLPTFPSMNRTHSDPEATTLRVENSTVVEGREIHSTPIYMPQIQEPLTAETLSTYASSTHSSKSLQHPIIPPPRTPSPAAQSQQQRLSPQNQPHPRVISPSASHQSLHHLLRNGTGGSGASSSNNGGGYSYTQHSLRPDSVCSFPDSSPLMAPNVLAAVNARLRESHRQQAQAQCSSSSTLTPRPMQETIGGNSTRGTSRASSIFATSPMTHSTILEHSGSIMSREDLYDFLNREDEEDEEDDHHLGRPKPGFASSLAGESSRRNSNSTSDGSRIELNARNRNIDGKVPAPAPALMSKGSIHSSKQTELNSGALAAQSNMREDHSSVDSSGSAIYAEKSKWLQKNGRSTRMWRRTCCAIGVVILAATIAGITLGFVLRKGKVDGLAPPPNPSQPDDPRTPLITNFPPDPNLHKSFYGLDYNPAKSLMPWCGMQLQDVINDVNLISQLTNRIRLYGMDCDQAALTFQAINLLKLNETMKVVLTVWVDQNTTTYERQRDTLYKVLDTYGTSMVQGVSVGNEVLFRKDMNLTALSALMKDVRTTIQSRYKVNIPVFTSEIGNNLNSALAAVSDELEGNLHPYFSGTAVADAAAWTFQQYDDKITSNPTPLKLKGAISEVGWPSAPASAVYPVASVPGLANMQTMIDTFICQANNQSIPYFWFEYKDEPWKTDPTVPVEPFWGLFDKDGNLKVTIPNCPVS